MAKIGNEPATGIPQVDGVHPTIDGITIRQQFVMAAMLAYIALSIDNAWSDEMVAEYACQVADATLAEEERTRG